MVKEVIEYLVCKPNGVYVDGTIGGGGHSFEILRQSSPSGKLIGIDCDEEAIRIATDRLRGFPNRIKIVCDNFINIKNINMVYVSSP